ncbi:carboxypeptidase-like regulatory domain-containing protein [Hymenobacter jeollabukensis]|uniref:Carboxypeptidase regulatory-like domain-containing protein n=1 Tax=Hymenobacter jeollabukensis TaxID=2025313 RepID=A0A5R8WJK5_9BACT|nr:carboxypeptidase-like regulatory domain-containing protein [Hymenobacter jeollabukensis]TLM88916.1 carboxypeptidase regulatory-like domain-containing protein [Hymenobacter jeollabukensis]
MNKSRTSLVGLALAGLLSACHSNPEPKPAQDAWGPQPALPVVDGTAAFSLGAADAYVNVMPTAARMPAFPALETQAGKVRGYVADLSGQPLAGAHLGLRSSVYYASALATTDSNGYYEIPAPVGAVSFYATGISRPYDQGQAVMGLCPADNDGAGFVSDGGKVKNFVLLSYGPGAPDQLSLHPSFESSYFGGALSFSYGIEDYASPPSYLPPSATIEVQLAPDGPGLFGETRTFTIRKEVGNVRTQFGVLNIPVGKYRLTARLQDGRALRMTEVGPRVGIYPHFGLKNSAAPGAASVLFTPTPGFEPSMAVPYAGNWRAVDIRLELP